ncbi:MAG: type II secretion system protein J [Planctomycetaceae bacterium]
MAQWHSGKGAKGKGTEVSLLPAPCSLLPAPSARGFTLVEMLVAVALTLVIMTMFATAFQISAGVMLKHRGVAENDQRARSVVTMLQADLQKRTYRQREDAQTETIFISGAAAVAGGEELFETNLSNTANRLGLGIVPLHPDYLLPGFGGKVREVDRAREQGYFYISENDPFNDGDDVVQFTVDAEITELGNSDTSPYTGRARPLAVGGTVAPTWNTGTNQPANTDQPIWDDGIGFKLTAAGNPGPYAGGDTGTSRSRYAEVSLFIRNGNLMRRVLLIRDPDIKNNPNEQPTRDGGAGEFIPGNYTQFEDASQTLPTSMNPNPGSDFWNDFDFSGTRVDAEIVAAEGERMRFNTANDLDNTRVFSTKTVGASFAGTKPLALGNPQCRFGHDPSPRRQPPPGVPRLQGLPKEHMNDVLPGTFMGRYTHEETSHPEFLFPGLNFTGLGTPTARGTPFSRGLFFTAQDTNNNGRVDGFENGPRKGEDILMTNVHAFDVKVWDAALNNGNGDWADLGHANTSGDWHSGQVYNPLVIPGTFAIYAQNPDYPPPRPLAPLRYQSAMRAMYRYGSLSPTIAATGAVNRVFDTWHPQFNFDAANDRFATEAQAREDALDDPPPFRPQWIDRPNFDLESLNVGDPTLVRSAPGTFNYRARPVVWTANTEYNFPFPRDGSNSYDPGLAPCRVIPQPRLRIVDQYYPGHHSMFYQVVEVQDLNNNGTFTSGPTEPAWPAVAGEEVQDEEIRWRAINNTIGLQAMQITVRFLDPTSQQMRQVTIIHPFTELY